MMPNLRNTAVAEWLAEQEPELAACLLTPGPPRLASVVIRLGQVLDTAQASDSHRLSRILRSSHLRGRMCLLLAQLDLASRLRVLAWFGAPPMPEPHLVAESFLSDSSDPGSKALSSEMQGLYRKVILLRIFRHDRLASLLAVCQVAGQAEEAA